MAYNDVSLDLNFRYEMRNEGTKMNKMNTVSINEDTREEKKCSES